MEAYPTFEQFARDVFLFFNCSLYEEAQYYPTPLVDNAAYAICVFSDAHCELFTNIYVKHELETLKNDEDLFKFAIPRCLKLIDEDRYYYSMMLVASFLKELVGFLRDSRVCYRFHFTVYMCFAAVYERFFKISFELRDGWNGLQDFIQEIIRDLTVTEEHFLIPVLNKGDSLMCSRVAELIENCDNCDVYDINDYEVLLLTDDYLKYIEEPLDNIEDDLLNMIWPPDKEAIFDWLNSNTTFSPSKGFNDNPGSFSILQVYVHNIEKEARDCLGTEEFLKKMKLRLCPCCGIKCYQFSLQLSLKQIVMADTY